MWKIAFGFIAGIIFIITVLFILLTNPSWLHRNNPEPEIKNTSLLGVNETTLFLESDIRGGGKGVRGAIYSIDLNDQKKKWKYFFKGFSGYKLYIHKNVVILDNFPELSGIDADTGKLLWSKTIEIQPPSANLGLVLSYQCGENLIFIDRYPKIRLYAFGLAQQDLLWNNDLGYDMGTGCFCTDREIYYATNEGYLYCLSADTGREIWHKSIFNEENISTTQ